LRFTYRDRHQQPSERRVEPHRLVHVRGRWYLAAYDLAREAWRSFRLDRIHPRVPTGPPHRAALPPESSWEGFVTRYNGAVTGYLVDDD
jgi:predicted DNA-binding transcriptional regulator YafY